DVVVEVRRAPLAPDQVLETPGNGLDGCERVVDLVAEHPDQPPPRLPLLLAQRAREVGKDQELVRQAAEPERAAAQLPAPARAARERRLQRALRAAAQAVAEAEVRRPPADQRVRRPAQQP